MVDKFVLNGIPSDDLIKEFQKKEYKLKQSVLSNEQSPVSKSLELPKEKNLSEFDEMTQELVKAFQNLSFPDKMEIMNLVLKRNGILRL